MRSTRKRYRRRSSRIRWFRRRVRIGTVYLLVSRGKPDLFKIGFTERPTKDRRRELERSSGEQLMVAFSVSLPWAYACEQRLHRHYRQRFGGRARDLGTEWYRLRGWESLEGVRRRITRAAALTKWEAWPKQSWPEGIEVRAYSNPGFFGSERDSRIT